MATNVIQKLTNLSSIHSMRKVKLALDQMPPTFTDMPLKCVPLPFFDIRNSVVVALVLCSFHLLIRDILLFKFQPYLKSRYYAQLASAPIYILCLGFRNSNENELRILLTAARKSRAWKFKSPSKAVSTFNNIQVKSLLWSIEEVAHYCHTGPGAPLIRHFYSKKMRTLWQSVKVVIMI